MHFYSFGCVLLLITSFLIVTMVAHVRAPCVDLAANQMCVIGGHLGYLYTLRFSLFVQAEKSSIDSSLHFGPDLI